MSSHLSRFIVFVAHYVILGDAQQSALYNGLMTYDTSTDKHCDLADGRLSFLMTQMSINILFKIIIALLNLFW